MQNFLSSVIKPASFTAKRWQCWHLSCCARSLRLHKTLGSLSFHSASAVAFSCSSYFMERAGGPNFSCVQCVCSPFPPLWPLCIPHPTKAHFSFIHSGCLLLGGSCSARQNTEHSFGALALLSTFSSQHLPQRCSCLAFFLLFSISLCCPSPPFGFPSSFSLPSLFLSLCGCWLGVWVLVAAVCCV